MVWMTDHDQERWPALYDFAKHLRKLVLSPSKRHVFEAFKKHSHLDYGRSALDVFSVLTPLTWGHGPQLQIVPFPCEMRNGTLQKRMGQTFSRRISTIAEDVGSDTSSRGPPTQTCG